MRSKPTTNGNCIDFHYLSKYNTKEFITKNIFQNSKAKKSYILITGSGTNSPSNRSVLRPYIKSLIENNNRLYQNGIKKWLYEWSIVMSGPTVHIEQVVAKIKNKKIEIQSNDKEKSLKKNDSAVFLPGGAWFNASESLKKVEGKSVSTLKMLKKTDGKLVIDTKTFTGTTIYTGFLSILQGQTCIVKRKVSYCFKMYTKKKERLVSFKKLILFQNNDRQNRCVFSGDYRVVKKRNCSTKIVLQGKTTILENKFLKKDLQIASIVIVVSDGHISIVVN